MALVTENSRKMQSLLYEAEQKAARERYQFSTTKTKTVVIKKSSKKVSKDINLELNGNQLDISDAEAHLGIQRTKTTKNTETVTSSIQSAKRAAYALMCDGFCGLNGIGPTLSKKLTYMSLQY